MPIHAPFLKYFREVARSGSVRTAAKRLYVSSSAVNRQILKIEAELGVDLFTRTPSGMTLTAAGSVLFDHVERTLSDLERCVAEIATLSGRSEAPITVSGQESIIAEFLPPVLRELHAALPQVCTAFKAAGGHELNRMLQERAADIAIEFDVKREPNIEIVATRELPVGAIVGPDHPIAGREKISLAECAGFPLILPDRSWPVREMIDDELVRLGLEPHIITSSNSVEFLRCMIDQHAGIGFQTAVGIEAQLNRHELVHVPLCDPEPVVQQLSVCVSTGLRRTPAIEQLLSLLETRLNTYLAR